MRCSTRSPDIHGASCVDTDGRDEPCLNSEFPRLTAGKKSRSALAPFSRSHRAAVSKPWMAFRGAPTWPGLSRRHCTYHRLQRLLALLHDHGQGEHEDLRLFRGSWILCWDDIGLELCAGWGAALPTALDSPLWQR